MNSFDKSLTLKGVYGITSDTDLPEAELLQKLDAVLASGISLLQFRSKSTAQEEKLRLAERVKQYCDKYSVPLLINDDCELCLQINAAGVHLGQSDTALVTARRLLGDQAIIGITCHDSIAKAKQAQQDGADYVAFGRFFASKTKPNAPPADLAVLSEAKKQLNIPIVAIGGINQENGDRALAAGANMLAVIDALFGPSQVEQCAINTRAICKLFDIT